MSPYTCCLALFGIKFSEEQWNNKLLCVYSALAPVQSLRHSLEVSQKQCELVDLGDVQFFVVLVFFLSFF